MKNTKIFTSMFGTIGAISGAIAAIVGVIAAIVGIIVGIITILNHNSELEILRIENLQLKTLLSECNHNLESLKNAYQGLIINLINNNKITLEYAKEIIPQKEVYQIVEQKVIIPDKKYFLYTDSLTQGWENWSWNCHSTLKSTEFIYSGKQSIKVKLNSFGGFAIGSHSGISTNGFDRLGFYINGGTSDKHQLKVFVNVNKSNGIRNPITISDSYGNIESNKWSFISIPLIDLDAKDEKIYKINISDISGNNYIDAFYLDEIMLFSVTK